MLQLRKINILFSHAFASMLDMGGVEFVVDNET